MKTDSTLRFLLCLALTSLAGLLHAATPSPAKTDFQSPLPAGAVQLSGWLADEMAVCRQGRLLGQSMPDLIDPFRTRPEDRQWRCEFWGKWYCAVALARRYSADSEIKALSDNAVSQLLETQSADGYIGTYQKKAELAEWDVWGRKYVLLGLLAHYDITGDGKALEAAVRAADYTIGQIGPSGADIVKLGNWNGLAASSLLEPMVLLYRRTGYQRYLDFAEYIVRRWGEPGGPDLVRKALNGVTVFKMFPGPDPKIEGYWGGGMSKAYEMMSCYEGLAELYRVTGDPSYLKALRFVTADIRSTEITVIGSGSIWERWSGGRTRQTEAIKEWMETCVTATWIKLCAQMLRLTGDPSYADDIERTAYNSLFSAQKEDGSWWCHSNPLSGPRAAAPEQCDAHVNCCVASGPRALFLLPQLGAMRCDDGLSVNLYLPGRSVAELSKGGTVQIVTETEYPTDGHVALRLSPTQPTEFALRLRIPGWSAETTLLINGAKQASPQPGSYAILKRVWKEGDRVEITFDMRPRRVGNPLPPGAPDSLRAYAIERGPLVLALDRRFANCPVKTVMGELAANAEGFIADCKRLPVDPSAGGPRLLLSVPFRTDGGDPIDLRFCDYASAGHTWAEDSSLRVWIPLSTDLSKLLNE